MSSSESKTSFPPTPISKQSSSTSSVPTDLTVSSTEQLKGDNRIKALEEQVKLLKLELAKRDSLVELNRKENEERIRKAEQTATEAEKAKKIVEESARLRMDLQTQEMNKIQTAISDQLREVTVRQQHLEDVNQKLREKADVAKLRLESFQYDPSRLAELRKGKPGDMSIFEFAELIIYKHIQPEREKNVNLQKHNIELQNKLSEIIRDVSNLEVTLKNQKRETESLELEVKVKNQEILNVKETVKSIDALNLSLQEKVMDMERMKLEHSRELERKEKELAMYKKKVEDLSQEFKVYASENVNLNLTLTTLRQEFNQIRLKFDGIEQRSEQGISTLSSFTKKMQEKQLELLEELSTSLFQHNLDQKYREQYLVTIRELVSEQIRTQQYISRVSAERDDLQAEVNKLSAQLNKSQINCTEERLLRSKEEEKFAALSREYHSVSRELDDKQLEIKNLRSDIKAPVQDVKNTREYQMLLKDLKLLLSHREEIDDLRELVLRLQEDS